MSKWKPAVRVFRKVNRVVRPDGSVVSSLSDQKETRKVLCHDPPAGCGQQIQYRVVSDPEVPSRELVVGERCPRCGWEIDMSGEEPRVVRSRS